MKAVRSKKSVVSDEYSSYYHISATVAVPGTSVKALLDSLSSHCQWYLVVQLVTEDESSVKLGMYSISQDGMDYGASERRCSLLTSNLPMLPSRVRHCVQWSERIETNPTTLRPTLKKSLQHEPTLMTGEVGPL
ncbi:hypothetical protein J6590_026744 [Homalodisca vitripennis]|nr:hypothetical protein J6590_026744 [Homalodisca vitripennis]